MPFFQATSLKLPLTKEKIASYPTAGPYTFRRNVPNVLTELGRNWRYRGTRQARPDDVKVHWNVDEQDGYQQVVAGKLDVGPLPDAEVKGVADRYGVNKTRFWVEPLNCLGYLALNPNRPQFARNVALRRALNWAVDRRAALALVPPYSGSPWTHLLVPGSPGSVTAERRRPYAGAPNLSKARRLAAGHIRPGTVNVGYRSSSSVGLGQAQLVRSALEAIGFKDARHQAEGLQRRRPLHGDGQAQHRPRPRGGRWAGAATFPIRSGRSASASTPSARASQVPPSTAPGWRPPRSSAARRARKRSASSTSRS